MESAWNTPISGAPGYHVYQKLEVTKKALQSWNKTFFGHIQTTIQHLTSAISSYQDLPPTTDNLHAVKSLNVALGEQLCREEIFWKQKSRVEWLVSSDLNTDNFHASTVTCRCRNQIVRLKDVDGHWFSGR